MDPLDYWNAKDMSGPQRYDAGEARDRPSRLLGRAAPAPSSSLD